MTRGQNLKVAVYHRTKDEVAMYSLEEYIVSVLAYEIQEDFHIEVLKAHAVMIRTYIIRNMRLFNGQGCSHHPQADLCNDPNHCLGSLPMEMIDPSRKKTYEQAVYETQDRVITYQGKLIIPYYHNTCGGATENSERVLGNTVQYTRKVLCDYCRSNSPHWQSSVEFTLEELEEKLNIRFPTFNPMEGAAIHRMFYDAERDDEGRILNVKVGDRYIKGKEIEKRLELNSNRFGWQPTGIRFFVQGKGHGLGLCQYGAQGLALNGKNYQEILNYYFTGIKIENMPEWSIKKPLQGKIILIDAGHGGNDKGLQLNHIVEKDMNLEVCLILEKKLVESGTDITMIRRDDRYIALSERIEYCNKLRPNFFLSIHGNDNPAMENTTQIYVYPGDIEAYELGTCMVEEFKRSGIVCREVTKADLYLARESKNSTLIIDLGYFFIENFETLERMADGIYRALLAYWGVNRLNSK